MIPVHWEVIMDKNVEHVLVDAIENKQSLTVVYLGGSQPGTLRNISPISINGDKLRARCHSSGAVKVFNLGKIQLPSDSCAVSMHYGEMTTFMPFILKDDGVLILMSIALLYLIFLKTGNEKKRHLWQLSSGKEMKRKY